MIEHDKSGEPFTVFDLAILLLIVTLFVLVGVTKSQLVDLQRRVGQIEASGTK